MPRSLSLLTLAIALFPFCRAAGVNRTEVVELWPGKVLDEPGGIGPEKVHQSRKLTKKEVEVTESTRLITNVTRPTITICRPSRDKDTGAAVVICPGGGYWDLYWELEGEEVAAWLNEHGITGIILKYRVPRRPDEPKGEPARRPLQDAQRAVSLVRSKAWDWGIDPNRIGMIGFSAGGHLVLATATGFEKRTYEPVDEIDRVSCRPDFAIAAYSGYLKAKEKDELALGLHIPKGTPPVFLVHGDADIISSPEGSVLFYLALKRAGVPAELHVYAGAAHDFAVRRVDHPCGTWPDRCLEWMRQQSIIPTSPAVKEQVPAAALQPWGSNRQPGDVAQRHTEEVATGKQEYRIAQAGTMDGENCRSPIGGSFGVWEQSWESNRSVRMENVGDADVINPWLSNGRNNYRSLSEIVAGVLRPEMTDRDKAIALWRFQTTHRFHASTGDAEANDPVKVINVYGYTTCGDDSICLAGLWKTAGFKVRPARVVGHCISQVQFDGRWNLLDGDMGPFYLLRDNATIAGESDLVRDHDLVKRTHTRGILDADSRAAAEWSAALFVYEGDTPGDRNSERKTTMNMVLRPNEAIVWRWGHLSPPKFHGPQAITSWGKSAAERICNGLWEYRPDFTREMWRKGVATIEHVTAEGGELKAEAGKTGVIVWRMRSPYVFVGGKLEIEDEGEGAKFSLSWDGKNWQPVGRNLDTLFPANGPARYDYQLRCELPAGARLRRLGIVNDLQMAPLALPGMIIGENRFTYTDESPGPRQIRLTHQWVERSTARPPEAPAAPIFPTDGGRTAGTGFVFRWFPAKAGEGDAIADYEFELSDRPDMAWPLSSNFSKLLSNTADRGLDRCYRPPYSGLLTPGRTYYWHIRAKSRAGVWGPWSATWNFIPEGPTEPLAVTLVPLADGRVALRWKANPVGEKPVKYRVYGSDEKGFTVSDVPYRRNVGQSKGVSAEAGANFVAETAESELIVLGPGLTLPNANRAFYRVVAIDAAGFRSGPSDFAAATRPFIFSQPAQTASIWNEYRYHVEAIRSLGDLRLRVIEGKEVAGFWDVETPKYSLVDGPAWLSVDAATGVLHGTPKVAGTVDVAIKVTLERAVRRLDPARLAWGQESVTGLGIEEVGSATQKFRITVGVADTTADWKKYEKNPVLGGNLGTCFDVSVLKEGYRYLMWFSWRPLKSIALIDSYDGINWRRSIRAPFLSTDKKRLIPGGEWNTPEIVLGPNPKTDWESDINRPVVIKNGNKYEMWYTGQARGKSWIGYATSPDGKTWERMSDKPVLSAEAPWEKVAVMCPHVIYDEKDKLYRMWYSGGEQYEPNAIGYATSRDGLKWEKHPKNPIFAPDAGSPWEKNRVTACQVIRHGDWHLMFYIGFRDRDHAQIGLARSKDGITGWERHPANPIIRPGKNQWDHDAVYKPYAIFDGKRWLLWYNGRKGGVEQIGLAIHEGEDLGF